MKKVRIFKTVVSCILIMTVIATTVTGCGKKKEDNNQSAKGTDAEALLNEAQTIDNEYIFKQENVEGVLVDNDYGTYIDYVGDKVKVIAITISGGLKCISVSKDGSDIQSFEIPIDMHLKRCNYAFDNDGNFYLQYSAFQSEDDMYDDSTGPIECCLLKYDNTGKELLKVDIFNEVKSEDAYTVSRMIMSQSNGLVFLTSRGIETYSEQDGFSVAIDANTIKNTCGGNEYTLLKGAGGKLFVVEFSDEGRLIRPVDLGNKALGKQSNGLEKNKYYMFFGGEGYDLYLNDEEVIYGYDSEADKLDKLIDIDDSELGSDYGIHLLTAASKTEMYAILDISEEEQSLVRLTKVNPEDVVKKTVVTVGGVYIDSDFNSFAQRFNRANDKYRVKVVDYSLSRTGEELSTEDMVNSFNMDILSGKVPDIIYFNDYIDINNYVNKGLLRDLTPEFEKGGALGDIEILPNIFEMMHINDKIYTAIPTFTLMSVIMRERYAEGKTTITYDECDELIKGKNVDYKAAFGPRDKSEMLYLGLVYAGNRYVDMQNKKCDFKNSDFIDLLKFANKFPGEFDDDYFEGGYEKFYKDDRSLFEEAYFSDFFNSYGRYKHAVFGEDFAFVGFPNNAGLNEACIRPESFGICSSSKNSEGAIAFIKALFGQGDISAGRFYNLPSNKAVFEKMMAESMEVEYETVDGEKKPVERFYNVGNEEIKAEPLTKEDVKKLYDYVLSVKTLYRYDLSIQNIVQEEASAFFSGQKTAEEVTDIIQSRVSTYLNENS